MNDTKNSYINDQSKYKQIVWDYKIQPKTFFAILEGKEKKGWFNQEWAIAKVLDNMNYYDVRDIIPLELLAEKWVNVKKRLFHSQIIKSYEYLLQKYSLSSTR
jgi:hypothetical protein